MRTRHCIFGLAALLGSVLLALPEAEARPAVEAPAGTKLIDLTQAGKARQAVALAAGDAMSLEVSGPGPVKGEVFRVLGQGSKGPATLVIRQGRKVLARAAATQAKGLVRLEDGTALGRAAPFRFVAPAGKQGLELSVLGGDARGVLVVFLAPELSVAAAPAVAAAPVEAPPAPPAAPLSEPPSAPGESPAPITAEVTPPAAPTSAVAPEAEPAATAAVYPTPSTEPATEARSPPAMSSPAEPLGSADDSPRLSRFGVGARVGAYHPSGNSDLGAALAYGLELRGDLFAAPLHLGKVFAVLSASRLTFSHSRTLTDAELGTFDTRFDLVFVPMTAELGLALPKVGPFNLYGGAAFAFYWAQSTSHAFGAKDVRTTTLPGFQAFGALGVTLGPAFVGFELRYTDVNVNFDTGTVGSGAGLFGQVVANAAFF